MGKTKRIHLLLAFAMAIIAALSCVFAVLSFKEDRKVSASAETIEYMDLLGIEDRTSWGACAVGGEYYFGGVTLNPFGYFNTVESVSGTWYVGNNALISANNGCDIMQYIYVNGQQAREAITANANGVAQSNACKCWLSNPAAYPIYVETSSAHGIMIRIAKAWSGDNFTFTFKKGFSLIRNDGNTIYLSEDVDYVIQNGVPSRVQKYTLSFQNEGGDVVATNRYKTGETLGVLPSVPAKDGLEGEWQIDGKTITSDNVYSYDGNKTATPVYVRNITNLIGLEDRTSWGAHNGEYYFGGLLSGAGYLNTHANLSNAWYVGNNSIIAANGGVDIMQYIYVNGQQAREVITANANGAAQSNACTCWLSNPAAYPIYVETSHEHGLMIRVASAWSGNNVTITFKAGFSVLGLDGYPMVLKEDITYRYNGALTKLNNYTLTFEGLEESKRITETMTVGALPEVPALEGFVGEWQIDSVTLTPETVYNYGADKTAVAVYTPIITGTDVSDTLRIEDWGNAESNDYTNIIVTNSGITLEAKEALKVYWNDHAASASDNEDCDIMEYIYINGVSARAIVTQNATDRVYGGDSNDVFPFNLGGVFAPVLVETSAFNGGSIIIRVLTEYLPKGTFTVTFKEGFKLVNKDGELLMLAKDVDLKYNLNYIGISSETVLPGSKLVEPETPVMDETESHSYLFMGWYVADLATGDPTDVKWDFDKDVVTGPLTLAPIFDEVEKPIYTVKFNANNGATIPSVNVYEGSFVKSWQIPKNPEKTATGYTYTFLGWYNGDDLYDFTSPVTEDITLTAKYSVSRGLNLSDLYNSAYEQTADFKDGQVEATAAGVYQVGYNGGEGFTLQFDIKFDTTPDSLSTFGIKMVRPGAALVPSSSDFYLGWHVYFYRPGASSYVTLVSSNGADVGVEGRNTLKAWDSWEGAPTLTAGNTYAVKIAYQLIDAATGTVEIYTKIANFEGKFTQALGADYVVNAKSYNQLYFYVEGAENAALKFSDSGYMDEPSYEATFSDGKTVETVSGRHFVLPERTQEGKAFVGWTTSQNFVAGSSDLYPAGYDMPASNGLKLYAVWIDFALQDGAAVKTGGGGGIRFLADIDGATYTAWENCGLIVGAGTLIVPTSYLESLPFVHSSFPVGYYNDVALEQWFKQEGNKWTYSAALINIPSTLYARSLSAKGYLQIAYSNGKTGYVYTHYDETNNARSMYEIATKAYDDYKSVVATYVNGVADIQLDKNFTASLSETSARIGEYTVSSVRTGATVAVTLTKNAGAQTNVGISLASALINGVRVVAGYSATVEIGGLYWEVKNNAMLVDDAFTFTLTPAVKGANKGSDEFVYYNSSDEELNFFLNDFTKRHSAYVENGVNQKVNSTMAGVNSQEFFSQEWNSLAYYWYDAVGTNDGYTEDRAAGLRDFLARVPVDDYGYVWQSNDNIRANDSTPTSGEHRMGWPFPNNKTMDTISWEFGGSDKTNWESSGISASNTGGLFKGTANGVTGSITFTSKTHLLGYNKFKTYYSPLLEFDIRIADATNVEDIYVWYQTTASKSWTEDKRVSVNEKAFIRYPYEGKYEHIIFLPMYAESAWGASTSTQVTQLRIQIKIKSGASLSGDVALNCVRPTMDTRHSNNNSILISSLRQDYDYTGDLDFLAANITRARKAMNFLMQMYDSARGLNRQSYLVGHDGDKESLNVLGNATKDSIAGSLSNGYWDISFMPVYDFQSNMYFYKALADMAHMEKVLEENGIVVDKSLATIKTATRQYTHGTSAYTYTSDSLNTLAETVKSAMQANAVSKDAGGFWNPNTGRFIAGYDEDGNQYDYGYVAWNLEAIYYGIATDAQATAIMSWLESEDDLYKYIFAPVTNTVQGDASMLNGEYEAQGDSWLNCQFGGAIMYTSFYDLMARVNVLGADNAYDRLTAIMAWYMEIYNEYVANGSTPDDFYWDYYYGVKYNGQHALQNGMKGTEERDGETAGVLGIDGEFLESYLLISAVPYGFFGIDALDGNTLQIAPALPSDLDYFTLENLTFNNVKYDLTIFEDCLQITSVRGAVNGQKIQAVFDVSGKTGYKVYVNGTQTNDYTVKNGKVYVSVDFGAAIVEVR